MKRTTLRTSAIALGVAAALPATAQEWNLQWGGFMNQHFVFGSTEQKHTSGDVSYEIGGDRNDRAEGQDFKMQVKFIAADHEDVEDATFRSGGSTSGQSVVADDEGNVFINPTDAALGFLNDSDAIIENTIYHALSTAVEEDNPQIKKVYIKSQSVAGNAISSVTLNEIADVVDALESTEFNTAYNSVSADDRQDLDGIEIYIVDSPALTPGQLVADPSTDPTNAYDQVNAALKNATIDLSGSGQRRNTEVHFKPSVTLENGITFAAAIELEGDAGQVDRSNMMISSDSLGKITLGAHSSMGYGMMVAAPSVGLGINDGAHHNFIPVSKGGAAGGTFLEVGGNWEPMRVSYQSPSLAGLTLGLSYAADGKGNGNSANHSGYLKTAETMGDLSDIFDVAAQFKQSLGETSFTLAARYGTAEQEGYSDKPRVVAVGGQVSFGGFTIGAGYADEEAPAGVDNDGWSLGASFKPTEAWTIGIETYQGEYDNGDDHSVSKIAARRNLGPGVNWDLYAITAESTSTSTVSNTVTQSRGANLVPTVHTFDSVNKTEASGTIFGTSINLSF